MKDHLNPATVPLEALQFERHDDEDTLLGLLQLGHYSMHVTAVRVEDKDGILEPTNDPYDRFDDFLRLDEGSFTTTEIPGFEGLWVIVCSPYCD